MIDYENHMWELMREEVNDSWDNKGDIVIGNDVWTGCESVIDQKRLV